MSPSKRRTARSSATYQPSGAYRDPAPAAPQLGRDELGQPPFGFTDAAQRGAGVTIKPVREPARPPGKERFVDRLRRQRQAGPDGYAVIVEKLVGAPVDLSSQGLAAARRPRGPRKLTQERTEPRIEVAGLQAASFVKLADLLRDSLRKFLIRPCHVFVTFQKDDIAPRALSFPLPFAIAPYSAKITLRPRVCLR